MLICPRCAEDCADEATTCPACRQPLPAWVTRPILTTPAAPRRLEAVAGYAFVVVAGGLLLIEALLSMGGALFDPRVR